MTEAGRATTRPASYINDRTRIAMVSPNKPARVVSQAPLKETQCFAGCGASVSYRTNPKVICASCKPSRRAKQMREVAERRRRKAGIPKVKGTRAKCCSCQAEIVLNRNLDAKFCPPCALEKSRSSARAASKKAWASKKGRKRLLDWQRMKRETDPKWRVCAHMRTLLHRALGEQKAGKSWREFVPYSLDQLMTHLERQFLPGMSWDNRGEWHIDHIRPQSSFAFESPSDPAFQECWALSNLRPLWAVDNIRKSDTRTHLL